MTPKQFFKITIPISLIFFIYFTYYFFVQEINRPKLPVLGTVKPFTLSSSENKLFHSDKLRGKVWIADFFFTTCSDICPMMTKHMASLHRTFELERDIDLVSFTVNPENDSPQALNDYAKKFNANTQKWFFLTGSREALTEVALKSFKLGDIKEPIFHSTYFTLVDRYGFIRGYYDGTQQEEVNRLFKDAARLLKESRLGF